MKILAIDTSSKICSVAILEDSNLITKKELNDEKTHSQKLMPMIDGILKECKLKLKDINLLACSVGPGSFTGVRIGVSTIKAFADTLDIPCVAISSLESLAYNIEETNFEKNPKIVCSCIDAKNDNVYFGMFERKDDKYIQIDNLLAVSINEVLALLKTKKFSDMIFVGDGAINHKYKILEKFSNVTFVEKRFNDQTSVSVGIAGYNHYLNGDYGTSNILSPLYLRKSQAERALEGEK